LVERDNTVSKNKVLIIEDDVVSLNLLVSIAEGAGFETETAPNGAEGLYLYLRNPDYTAVLLDLMMPEVDGLELLKVIESLYKSGTLEGHGKIIVETALTNFQVLKELVNYKAVHSVRNKPIRKDELVRDLTRLAGKG
jgi:CheY-like chemotaxis protein